MINQQFGHFKYVYISPYQWLKGVPARAHKYMRYRAREKQMMITQMEGLRGTERAKTPAQVLNGAAAGAPQIPHVPVPAF